MRRLLSLLSCAALVMTLAALDALAAASPARVLLQSQAGADGTVQVTATVVDADGAPVAEVPLVFKGRTAFGWLTVHEAATDKEGRARTVLPAGRLPGEIAVEAGDEGEIHAAILIGKREAVPPSIRPGRDVLRGMSPQPGFISPYPVPLQATLFSLVLGAIWSTYGYVLWLLLRIRRERQP